MFSRSHVRAFSTSTAKRQWNPFLRAKPEATVPLQLYLQQTEKMVALQDEWAKKVDQVKDGWKKEVVEAKDGWMKEMVEAKNEVVAIKDKLISEHIKSSAKDNEIYRLQMENVELRALIQSSLENCKL